MPLRETGMDESLGLLARLWRTAVVWSWAYNALRLAAGFLLLPLLLRLLSTPDFGMHFVFQSVAALAMMLDFGFSGAVFRATCFALAGGTEWQSLGLPAAESNQSGPNRALLWQIVRATRLLYRWLALGSIVLLGATGTMLVAPRFAETSVPALTWMAWTVTLLGVAWELLASWWGVVLIAMNQVVLAARLNVLAYALKLALAAALLVAGAGLLSVPLAGLVASIVQRSLMRRACLRFMPPEDLPAQENPRALLARLWPTSWRQGLMGLGTYGGNVATAFICMEVFGLAANARYGLSLQIMALMQGMAAVWTQVKWPLLSQQRARGDLAAMRRLFQPRLWLQLATFIGMAVVAIPVAPHFVKFIAASKEVLPVSWLALLALNALLDMHLSTWGTLITTENRVPVLWPMLVSTAASLTLMLSLINSTALGLGALVLAPLAVGCLFNYWRWPLEGARTL
ncbi:MAG: hypothetical protein HY300_06290, partial [Verrucomicrobia bacterium]|nr:hypothetical protein [Verrucomicrobiota bacterium]